jgi:hypothetical protein
MLLLASTTVKRSAFGDADFEVGLARASEASLVFVAVEDGQDWREAPVAFRAFYRALGTGPPCSAKQPTSITVPEIASASGESKNATARATSSLVAGRPAALPGDGSPAMKFPDSRRPADIPVLKPPPPGTTVFTRILWRKKSYASAWLNANTPPLLAA